MADPARRRFIPSDFSHSSDSQESDAAEEAHTAPAARPNVGEPPPVETLVYSGGAWPPVTPSLSAPVHMTTRLMDSPAPGAKVFTEEEIKAYREAAKNGNLEVVIKTVKAGMPVDARSAGSSAKESKYAIASAAEYGRELVVRYLVEKGAGEEARKKAFAAAVCGLHAAIQGATFAGDTATCIRIGNYLLRTFPEGRDRDQMVASVKSALHTGFGVALNILLNATGHDQLVSIFHSAAKTGDTAVVKACIAAGLSVSAREKLDHPAALVQAARRGHVDVVEFLLSKKPPPGDKSEALCSVACELAFTREAQLRSMLIEAARRILHSYLVPATLQQSLSNKLEERGDKEAAQELRAIRLQ